MNFKWFAWSSLKPTAQRSGDVAAARTARSAQACPPCTGTCYQGRACPRASRTDSVPLDALRRGPVR